MHLQGLSFLTGINSLGSCEDYNAGFADVHLTELETAAVLYQARMQKHYALEEMQKQEAKRKYLRNLERQWNWEEMKAWVLSTAVCRFGYSENNGADGKPVYLLDAHNERIFEMLCKYFTYDRGFESMGEGYSLQKGLLLMGNVGRGKTDLMKIFCGNQRQSYSVVSVRQVAKHFAMDGHTAMEAYSTLRHEVAGDIRFFNQRVLGYCFDDLGTEQVKNNYGNKSNVMEEIILNRYDARNTMPFWFTHFTTNLNADEIERMYGTRARSRLREMCNIIQLEGNDRRQ
jgi:ATPase subunit of ABC transporter with duplicated ATPase domains